MPGFPFPGRPGGEHDEPLLDMIIARRALPPDAPGEMHDLARMLAALAGPAEPGELTGEAAVRAAFRRAVAPVGVSAAARRPGHRRTSRRSRGPARSRVRLATVLVAAAAGLGSVLAAYTGLLPSPIQQVAHDTVAAPAPHSSRPDRSTAYAAAQAARPEVSKTSHRPAPGPERSASAARPTPPVHSHKPGFGLVSPGTPGYRPGEPTCSPSLGHTPSPSPKASAHPSSVPSWYQGEYYCVPVRPTSTPSSYPYVP